MAGKYTIPKEDLRHLFAIIDMELRGKYHDVYEYLGCKHDKGQSFECINSSAHSLGKDSNPSMSISNDTGQGHCFTCGIKFNLPSFYKEWVASTPHDNNEGSFTSFMVDYLHLDRFVSFNSDPKNQQNKLEMKTLYEKMNNEHITLSGKPYDMPVEVKEEVKKESFLDIKINDAYVEALLANKEMMEMLEKTRGIKMEHILKYRIGYNGSAITFPMISINGDLVNIKAYRPWVTRQRDKWYYPFEGYQVIPTPVINFTHNKIYLFEGEPDAYTAIAFGLNGATFGPATNNNANTVLGETLAKQLFTGKEVVICMDADEPGMKASISIAESIYNYAKQIKIIDLNKSDMSPYGLDPNVMKDVEGKQKRAEKDFTEFIQLNGFSDNALKLFLELEKNTKVYTENKPRKRKEIFKVTLQEARLSRYYSDDRSIELDLVASVGDLDRDSYKYPKAIEAKCKCMKDDKQTTKMCQSCSIYNKTGFGNTNDMTFKIEAERNSKDEFSIGVKVHDILGLIETTEQKKYSQVKKLLNIPERCNEIVLTDKGVNGLLHVRLVRDLAEASDSSNNNCEAGASEIEIEAYMLEKEIYPNKSYRFNAVQILAWNNQNAVLFCYSAEPIATSIDTFKMNEDTNEILQVFKPKQNESIKEHLQRRYSVFSNASGINHREDLFFVNDLVYFSPIEINNKIVLPAVKRGWVEALIAGDTRCGKTIVSKFLHNHYKMGEFIGGSTAVSRTGLVAAIEHFHNKPTIKWGKFPMNDGGIVIIDELSIIKEEDFESLTSLRSDGIAEIVKQKTGKMSARVRKIMLSNKRIYKNVEYDSDTAGDGYGIKMLKKLCFKDQILSRFDIAYIVSRKDVKASEFTAYYEQMPTEFTEYQCQTLIKWAYSRKPYDVVFEEGFEEKITKAQDIMLKKFHESTQLVNQEMRAKLARLSISLATMLYSTIENDWNKIFVKNEYVDYIVEYLTRIYCGPNMQLDRFSHIQTNSENLGDMKFMMNILKYTDINLLMQYDELTSDDLKDIFASYLSRVVNHRLYIIEGSGNCNAIIGRNIHEIFSIFTSLLLSRHCITKFTNKKYKKTEKFNTWLSDRLNDMEEGKCVEQSDILELTFTEQNSEVDKKTGWSDPSNWRFKRQKNT